MYHLKRVRREQEIGILVGLEKKLCKSMIINIYLHKENI